MFAATLPLRSQRGFLRARLADGSDVSVPFGLKPVPDPASRRSEADVLRRGGRVAFAPMRVLVTGGAGFVGANVAVALAARHPDWQLVALDNLRRRGAELNLARLWEAGVVFLHGDVREPADLEAADEVDALVECSAEPSVL